MSQVSSHRLGLYTSHCGDKRFSDGPFLIRLSLRLLSTQVQSQRDVGKQPQNSAFHMSFNYFDVLGKSIGEEMYFGEKNLRYLKNTFSSGVYNATNNN